MNSHHCIWIQPSLHLSSAQHTFGARGCGDHCSRRTGFPTVILSRLVQDHIPALPNPLTNQQNLGSLSATDEMPMPTAATAFPTFDFSSTTTRPRHGNRPSLPKSSRISSSTQRNNRDQDGQPPPYLSTAQPTMMTFPRTRWTASPNDFGILTNAPASGSTFGEFTSGRSGRPG